MARALSAPLDFVHGEVERTAPFITDHPRLCAALAGAAALGGSLAYRRYQRSRGLERAAALTSCVSAGRRGWPQLFFTRECECFVSSCCGL